MGDDRIANGELGRLALYRRCVERIQHEWPGFQERRDKRVIPHPLLGDAAEKVAESILEDLFTTVLDWPLSSFNPQVEHADIVLTDLAIKRIIVEVKRPGALSWNRRAVEQALEQATRYASDQKVKCVAVSDGAMLYAADLNDGGMQDRIFVSLASNEAPLELWWISSCGIYRPVEERTAGVLRFPREEPIAAQSPAPNEAIESLMHPRYKLPARCFAFVPDFSNPRTWKLPYLLLDGTVDAKRLPKAIQAILSNYRGAKVGGIPEEAIPAVLQRLAQAAMQAGHMPPLASNPAPVYRQLAEALEQLGVNLEGY